MALAAILLLIPFFSGVTGCRSRTEQPLKVDAGAANTQADRETSEYGVTNTSLYQYAGTMDVENRYVSTVMITTDAQSRTVLCSGVVINPRVVLTAASCLCEPGKSASIPIKGKILGRGVSCLERAAVTTAIYEAAQDKDYPEATSSMSFNSYEGTVRPHPEFTPGSENSNSAKPGHADLAVIVLDEAVKGVPSEPLMEQGEVQAREPLVMAGYADTKSHRTVGGLYGIRYFRKNTVTQVLAPEEGRVLYQQQGPSIYNGYSGGPCFREAAQRHLLVGIASIGTDQELSFTRVSQYRDWLRAEVRRAATDIPPTPNH
ncbi:trypsin-like serine protease [Hyalangium sp.]|uniref:trypsin-like serine protease n=1 Tax=Hyalangium sp. TaxID=2028555 RepID=UPI00389A8369